MVRNRSVLRFIVSSAFSSRRPVAGFQPGVTWLFGVSRFSMSDRCSVQLHALPQHTPRLDASSIGCDVHVLRINE